MHINSRHYIKFRWIALHGLLEKWYLKKAKGLYKVWRDGDENWIFFTHFSEVVRFISYISLNVKSGTVFFDCEKVYSKHFSFLKKLPPVFDFCNNEKAFLTKAYPHDIPEENIRISKVLISREEPYIFKIKILYETCYIYLQSNTKQSFNYFLSMSDSLFFNFPSLKMAYEYLKKQLSLKYDISFFNVEYSAVDVERDFKLFIS